MYIWCPQNVPIILPPHPLVCIFTQPPLISFLTASAFEVHPPPPPVQTSYVQCTMPGHEIQLTFFSRLSISFLFNLNKVRATFCVSNKETMASLLAPLTSINRAMHGLGSLIMWGLVVARIVLSAMRVCYPRSCMYVEGMYEYIWYLHRGRYLKFRCSKET